MHIQFLSCICTCTLQVCSHFTKTKTGGRPSKRRPFTSGRLKGGSVNMVLGHAREVAPAKISEAKLSPTASTNTTAVYKVCTCLLQSPVMLPCLHHICVDCLCLRIQQSGQIICADCQTTHPMVTASVQVAPPLSLSLLADQPAQCPSCKEEVQLKNSTKHLSSGCTMRKHITMQHILQEELDVPLTKLEERVGSNIVR